MPVTTSAARRGTWCAAAAIVVAACGDDAVTSGSGGGGAGPSSTAGPTTGSAVTTTSGPTSSASSSGGGGPGSGGAGGQGTGGQGAGGAGGSGPWEACSLFTGQDDGSAECATFEVPADRGDDSLGTVHVFVKKVAATAPRRGSVWLLSGGPGQSGVTWEGLAPTLASSLPDLDVMMMDHRGTGRSDRLGCPEAEAVGSDEGPDVSFAELPGCVAALEAEWGERLATFNGTQAAMDLGELIERTRSPGDQPFVYGVSYGSQWGHRYLQIYPDQAAGVALEANCVPDCNFVEIDAWFEALGEAYMGACAGDAFCSSKLGADPWGELGTATSSLASCPGLDARLEASAVKTLLASTLYSYQERKLVPAIAYRVNRCSAADVNALNHFAEVVFTPLAEPLPPEVELDSELLGVNVGLIDNFPDAPPDLATMEAANEAQAIALGASVRARRAFDIWPTHPKDAYHGAFASTEVPLLMVHGALDFIPVANAEAAADQLAGSVFTLLVLPTAPHGASFQSPLQTAGHCGARALFSFLADPTSPPDTSCVDDIRPLDFDIPSSLALNAFGTADGYEGDPGPGFVALAAERRAASPEATRDFARRLRRRLPDAFGR